MARVPYAEGRPEEALAIAEALSDRARPRWQRARDARDRTAELLEFAGVRPGDTVADFLPYRGYFTSLFSALAGPSGRIYAAIPATLASVERISKGQVEVEAIARDRLNVTIVSGPMEAAGGLPRSLDLFWTSGNYHDLHGPLAGSLDIAAFNAAVYTALKPGGRMIVIDHAAAADASPAAAAALHRIRPDLVRREIEAAGLAFEAEAGMLANPADRRSRSIFAHGTRYRTDRFAFRFRKPA